MQHAPPTVPLTLLTPSIAQAPASVRSPSRFLGRTIAALGLVALACHASAAPRVARDSIAAWETYADQSKLLTPARHLAWSSKAALPLHITVDVSQRYQEMVGFGASITDASAWLIQQRMSQKQRQALMQDLFGKAPGIGLSFTRLTIGASDFSRTHYTLDDVPAGQTDYPLAKFSIAPMREDVLPVVKSALAINPALRVMASPWSAPAWMKSNDHLYQGKLKPEAYGVFAQYLNTFADAMAAEGVPLFAMTLQNEPHFEPEGYPGMRVDSAARAEFIGKHLGPLFAQRKQPIRILEWDHNWQDSQAPLQVLADSTANRYIDGVAWHCYEGDVAAQSVVHDAYPTKDTYFTECSGGKWKPHWAETLPWYMRNLIIGTTRNWARGVLLWNIALDENDGPHLGGCSDCRGVVTINSKTGAVTRNFDYYALAHVSRFVRAGATRIGSSAEQNDVGSVAFENADDHSIVLVVANYCADPRRFSVGMGAKTFTHQLPGSGVVTFVWKMPHA